MNTRTLVFTTVVLLTGLVACSKETTIDTSTVTTTATTETIVTNDTTMTTESSTIDSSVTTTVATTVETTTPDGAEQIKEGAKQIGQGLKEETRKAVAVAGEAMEKAGEKMQEKAAEAAPPPATTPAPPPTPQPAASGNVASGASLFKAKCGSCHGVDASGNTAIGKKNNVRDLRSAAVQSQTDAQLATMIANGKAGGVSASAHKSKALAPDQIKDIIAYLRSIRT